MMQVPDAASRYEVSMRSIMSAGEQVGAEVFHWADETLGVKVNEMWGQTETNYLVGNCSASHGRAPRLDGPALPRARPWASSTTPETRWTTVPWASSRPGATTR